MVELGSEVVGIYKGKRFEGRLFSIMPPLPRMETYQETLYRIELPSGKQIDVTAHQFMGVGGKNVEEAE